jgi:hypothetical protein
LVANNLQKGESQYFFYFAMVLTTTMDQDRVIADCNWNNPHHLAMAPVESHIYSVEEMTAFCETKWDKHTAYKKTVSGIAPALLLPWNDFCINQRIALSTPNCRGFTRLTRTIGATGFGEHLLP